MTCRRCLERGKTTDRTDPKCAFESGTFSPDNWDCGTMNALRERGEKTRSYCEDQSAALVPIFREGRYIILGWYKNRGKTEYAGVLDEEEIKPLSLEDAELALSKG